MFPFTNVQFQKFERQNKTKVDNDPVYIYEKKHVFIYLS